METTLIGEQVESLRFQCTGQKPVHFYRKIGGVVLGLALGMAPLSTVVAASAPVPVQARKGPVLVAQTVDNFYRVRNGAPLWFSPKAGDSAEALISLLNTSNIDGL